MEKRNGWVFFVGLALVLVISGVAASAPRGGGKPQDQAGPRRPPRQGEMAMGTIASVGVGSFEIKKTDGSTEAITVNDSTRYQEGQQQIQLEDLKPGDHVFVRGQSGGQNQFTAMMVRRVTEEEMSRFQNRGDRAFGQIVGINGNEIKIQNPRQGEQTIQVTDSTTFMKDGQPIALKDLKPGDRVFAMGKLENGQFTAERVTTGNLRRRGGRGGFGGGREQPPGQPPL